MLDPVPPITPRGFALAVVLGVLLAIGAAFVASELLRAVVDAAHAVRGLP